MGISCGKQSPTPPPPPPPPQKKKKKGFHERDLHHACFLGKVASTLEVIPRTLAQNCGANVIRTITKLRAKHAEDSDCTFGIDGNTGKITDMKVGATSLKVARAAPCLWLNTRSLYCGHWLAPPFPVGLAS